MRRALFLTTFGLLLLLGGCMYPVYALALLSDDDDDDANPAALPPGPAVQVVFPDTGPTSGATVVTITGADFEPGATVAFGFQPAFGVTVFSPNVLTCSTPAFPLGKADIFVTNPNGGVGTLPQAFLYTGSPPTLTGVSPGAGPLAGGTVVTLSGSGFSAGATVTVGGQLALSTTLISGNTMQATTAAGLIGPADVVITNPDLSSATATGGFNYLAPIPTLSAVAPGTGQPSGGAFVTLTGTNFVPGAGVTFGGGAASGVTVVSPTTITCVTPPGSGTVTAAVTNPDLQTANLPSAFAYTGSGPTPTGVAPGSGPATGSTAITISGVGFASGDAVTIGGTAATSVVFVNANTLTATTPSGSPGSASVVVTPSAGSPGTLPNGYLYLGPAPTLTGVAPSPIPVAGGTTLTLTGTNFLSGATVDVDGAAATGVTFVSATTLTAVAPPGAQGPADVTVHNPDTQSVTRLSAVLYQGAAPTITSTSPASGPSTGGTTVTITGTNFDPGVTVSFGATPAASVTFRFPGLIEAVTPAAAGTTAITVTNPDTQTASVAAAFTFVPPPPSITGVSPSNGPTAGGTAVTITGAGFVNGATVTVGGNAAPTVTFVSSTRIDISTPAGSAGSATVVVTNPDLQSASLPGGFLYGSGVPTPTVTGIAPAAGSNAGGTLVTITGTNFITGATADLGGSALSTPVVVSATTLTGTTTAHTTGLVAVNVHNPGPVTGSLNNAFTYQPALTLSAVVPPSGSVFGGTTIVVYGAGILPGATVTVGGTLAPTPVVNASGTEISAVTPVGSTGLANVTVTNPGGGGQNQTLTNAFTYVTAGVGPAIGDLTVRAGPAAGGTTLTIVGAGFNTVGTTTVYFGTNAVTATVLSSNVLTVTTPAGTAGTVVQVAVVNPNGLSTTDLGGFTYTGGDSTAPSFAGVVSATALTSNTVELTWAAATDNVSPVSRLRYAVYWATSSGSQNFAAPPQYLTDPGVTTFAAGGLPANTALFFVVRASDETGNQDTNTAEQSATTATAGTTSWTDAGNIGGGARYLHTTSLLSDGRVIVVAGESGGASTKVRIFDPASGWGSATDIPNARRRAAAASLADGRPIIGGGEAAGTATNDVRIYLSGTDSWVAGGTFPTAVAEHTMTLLRDGRVLTCGGDNGGAQSQSATFNGTAWTSTTGAMGTARYGHTATLLRDGTVLAVGGQAVAALQSSEVFTPGADSWAGTTGAPGAARFHHTATLLPDGFVLVVGGDSGAGALSSAELYDPTNGTWSTLSASLSAARRRHTALLVPDGRVLLVGGNGGSGALATTEWYDPVTQSFSAGPALIAARESHGAVLLHDGRALVTGGFAGTALQSTEALDLAQAGGGFRFGASGPVARRYHAVTPLPDGRLLVTGGENATSGLLDNAALYDPATGTWTTAGTMGKKRGEHTATLLSDGRVLVAGGFKTTTAQADAELYDPSTGTWTVTGSLTAVRARHSATLLTDGRVLVAGGAFDGTADGLKSSEIYDPSTGTWSALSDMGDKHRNHRAVLLLDGSVLVIGGRKDANPGDKVERWTAAGGWNDADNLTVKRAHHTATLLPNGRVLVAGGLDDNGYLSSAEIYDPAGNIWAAAGTLSVARAHHTATLLPGGRVVVVGGSTGSGETSSAEYFFGGGWRPAGTLITARRDHTAARLPNGRLLVIGGFSGTSETASSESFDDGRGAADAARPVVRTIAGVPQGPVKLTYGAAVQLSGWRLRGQSEANGGGRDGGSDVPTVELVGPLGGHSNMSESGVGRVIPLAVSSGASGELLTFTAPASSSTQPKGYYELRITVTGMPSVGWIVQLP